MPDLIVIYGPPLSGKSTLAAALGRAMPERTAIVSSDHLLNEAIVNPDSDRTAELDLVHQQVRLLVANYLKFQYHCIVEGPFIFERGGGLASYEAHIDQLLALMRMMTLRKVIVRLEAPPAELARRAKATERDADLDLAARITGAYSARASPELRTYNTGAHTTAEIVGSILEELPGMARGQS